MTSSIIAWAALAAISPLAEYAEHPPQFVDPAGIELQQSTVALFTHASAHFDPLRLTKPAVNQVVARMKRRGFPVIYMHDRYNQSNSPWLYLYSDWKPTAFIESEIGHFDINMSSVRHVVCLGGFFWRCEKNTVTDSIRLWRRDAPNHDLRITQVIDGIFDVAEAAVPPYRNRIRTYQAEQLWPRYPNASMTVEQIVNLIQDDDLAIDFLRRQLPALPADVNVSMDFFGRRIKIAKVDSSNTQQSAGQRVPELVLAYRTSDEFLSRSSQHRSRLRVTKALKQFVKWPETVESFLRRKLDAGEDLQSNIARPLSWVATHLAASVQHRRTTTMRIVP